MHVEAWWMAFQNLGYAPPAWPERRERTGSERLAFAAGEVELGSGADAGFIFDNEKWRHPAAFAAFDIDATPVGEAEFAEFVDAGGYRRRELWSDSGWQWRVASRAEHPLYWRQAPHRAWQVRRFERWTPLEPSVPMLHVNRFEAEAFATWRGRALPTAAQWLRATLQREFRWGEAWEWLRDPFEPYPGFAPDPYRDYSQPWFATHWELRGGSPVTDPVLKRPGFRNFYLPHRRDAFAGFRTVRAARSV
jgi:ergothioneine biosynthesis protein EgtB